MSLFRKFIVLTAACFLVLIGQRSDLCAQGTGASGVPIKISAWSRSAVVPEENYAFLGRLPWMGQSFTDNDGWNFYACHVDGVVDPAPGWVVNQNWWSIGKFPNDVTTGQYHYDVTAWGQILYSYCWSWTNTPRSLQLTGTFMSPNPTVAATPTVAQVSSATANRLIQTSMGAAGTVQVESGRSYTLNIVRTNLLPEGKVSIVVPPQYRVVMNGLARNSVDLTDTVVFMVVPQNQGPPGAAGFASSVATSRLDWEVALGSLRNGDTAGSLRMVETALAESWDGFFSPGMLYYEASSDEVYVHRESNVIRQIIANQVAIDIKPVENVPDTYDILCYHPSQMSGAAPATFSGKPFVEYRVAKGGTATTILFTKTVRNVTDPNDNSPPIARIETMSLARTGTWPNYTWSKVDWTKSGETALVGTTVVSVGTANSDGSVTGRTETASVQAPGTTAAKVRVARTYAWGGAGEVLQRETLGTTAGNSPWTEFTYYTDINQWGRYGYVKNVALAGGQWEAYDYDANVTGRVKTRYRPYGGSPATAPANPSLTAGEVTSYTYSADPFGFLSRPATIVTKINDRVTSQTNITYSAPGAGLVTSTRSDSSDSSNVLQTVTKFYSEATTDAFIRGKPYSVIQPGAVQQSFAYQRGTWSAGTFAAGASPNTASRIAVIFGSATAAAGSAYNTENGFTIDPLYLVDGKSTKTVTIRDAHALVVRTESHVWKNSAWQPVSFVDYAYNFFGLLTSKVASNGATQTASYDGLLKTSETDESGVKTDYFYDAAARVGQTIRRGGTTGTPPVTIPDLITRFTYDAAGNVLEQRVGPTTVGAENLVTTKTFDDSGRLLTEALPGLEATGHSYNVATNSHTVTNPDGGTVTEIKGIDGRPLSRTGTAVVAQYFTYGVETDGRQWVKANTGTVASARWQKSWQDWLGRETRLERPSFATSLAQPKFVGTKTYEAATGRLISSTSTGSAATLHTYDALGRRFRSGLDVNGNGILDLNGTDRISETDQTLESFNGAWWARTETRQYAQASVGTPTIMAVSRQRLTGFTAGLLSETQSIDVNGNVTTATTVVNRSAATATLTTTTPGAGAAQIESKLAGLTLAVRASDMLTTGFGYDTLWRKTAVKNSRMFAGVNLTTTSAYHAGSLLTASVTDPTGVVVSLATYDGMGRVISQSGAPDPAAGNIRHKVYTRYNFRSQPVIQWGDATNPISYGYDSSTGERVSLTTYRAGTGWDQPDWPGTGANTAGSIGPADTTLWSYDPPTGLLAAKTSSRPDTSVAAGVNNQPTTVSYTYDSRGQLTSRTWSRGVRTDYLYDAATGEQRDILYSDGTPELHYTYNRLGQATNIDDATGSRVLNHCICGKVAAEHFDASFYGGRHLTYNLNSSTTSGGPLGRTLGYTLRNAASASEQTVSYGYNAATDRFSTLTTETPGVAAASHTFTYGYLANSNLLSGLYDSDFTFVVTRQYEEKRDVLTSIDSQSLLTGFSVARYDYVVDALGQRNSVTQNGSAFSDYYEANATTTPLHQTFAYDGRGQLTAASTYLGATASSTQALPHRQYRHAYDNIGNRQSSSRSTDEAGNPVNVEAYTANALNQYLTKQNKTVSLSGTAEATAKVVVSGRTTPVVAQRQGRFWADELPVANASGPWHAPLSIYFGKAGAGPSGVDFVRLETRIGQTAANPQAFTYDADGNLLNDGVWTYVWDAENRLIRMDTAPGAVTAGFAGRSLRFRYDYLGRRVQKLVVDVATSQIISGRRFLYDGWNLIAEFTDVGAAAIGAKVRTYTWGLDIARTMSDAGGVGALLQIADHAAGKAYFPTYDGNGNLTALLNATTGAVAAAYEYSPFGEPVRTQTIDSAVADQPFRFSTKYTDMETGLVYYGRRYYDPKTGRWLGRDPKEELGGLHLYGFVRNNPVNRWDYLGMTPSGNVYVGNAVDPTTGKVVSNTAKFWGGYHDEEEYGGPTSGSFDMLQEPQSPSEAGVSPMVREKKRGVSAFMEMPNDVKKQLCDSYLNTARYDEFYGPGLMDSFSKYGGAWRESGFTVGRYENDKGDNTYVTNELHYGNWWVGDNVTDPFKNNWLMVGPNNELKAPGPNDGNGPTIRDLPGQEFKNNGATLTGIYSFHTHPGDFGGSGGLSDRDIMSYSVDPRYGKTAVPYLMSGAFDGKNQTFFGVDKTGDGRVALSFSDLREALGCK